MSKARPDKIDKLTSIEREIESQRRVLGDLVQEFGHAVTVEALTRQAAVVIVDRIRGQAAKMRRGGDVMTGGSLYGAAVPLVLAAALVSGAAVAVLLPGLIPNRSVRRT